MSITVSTPTIDPTAQAATTPVSVTQSVTIPTTDPAIGADPVRTVEKSQRKSGPHPDAVLLPSALEIVPWTDPSFETSGHDPRSDYVERFWLPLLGPSTTLVLRRFARGLEACPAGFRVDLVETGLALGIGDSMARNSTTQRSISRACQFGAAYRMNETRLAVRTHLPTLTRRQVARLPELLQRTHEQWTAQPVDDDALRRATAAATGLVMSGETLGSVERQLRAWGYPPRAARDAALAGIDARPSTYG